MTQRIDFNLRNGVVTAQLAGVGTIETPRSVEALLLYAILHELRSMK